MMIKRNSVCRLILTNSCTCHTYVHALESMRCQITSLFCTMCSTALECHLTRLHAIGEHINFCITFLPAKSFFVILNKYAFTKSLNQTQRAHNTTAAAVFAVYFSAIFVEQKALTFIPLK